MTNQIGTGSIYSLINSSMSTLGIYSMDNYEPQLEDSEELRQAQANYSAIQNQITSIENEIEYINSLPEKPHEHNSSCGYYNGRYYYASGNREGCKYDDLPVMTPYQKAQKTKELELQKSQATYQLNQAGRELISAQRVSYRNSFLSQMGIRTSSTISMNTALLGDLAGTSAQGANSSNGTSNSTATEGTANGGELSQVLSNFKGAWFNVKAANGDFGYAQRSRAKF